ncbi:MAG: single-stranded DNA-binding protein [Candidatus Cloacimonetes bacterium]|nr:single-stranded DNA-binding protein [Candidatus Cloacimonadota bacterium]
MSKAPTLNHVIIAGNVVADPAIRKVNEKSSVAKITVAHNRSFQDKDGNWKDEATFVDVECWGNIVKKIEKSVKKGVAVIVEGSLQLNKWQDKEGNNHSKLFIHASNLYILNPEEF